MQDSNLLYNPQKVYKRKKDLMPSAFCRLTSFLRIMPDYYVGGAQKGGTTSLYYAFTQHPQVIPSKNKEMFFYSVTPNYEKGLYYYRQFFATSFYKWLKEFKSGKRAFCFDCTTNALDSIEAPKRILKDNPEAKVIFMLRNPVERAFSHYKMAVKKGWEYADFEKALELEEKRIEEGCMHQLSHPFHNYAYQRLGYRSRGIYVNQIKNWLANFKKENILIVNSENFFHHPQNVFGTICEFLKMEPEKNIRFEKLNEGASEKINEDVRTKLNSFYKPYNEELFTLIHERYDW